MVEDIKSSESPSPPPRVQGRVLALDWGEKRIGVAVSDELVMSVRPLPLIRRTSWKQTIRIISKLCIDYDVRTVVIGLPLRLDGTEGDSAREVRRIARNMSATLKIPIEFQDERYTSKEALNLLSEKGYGLNESHELNDGEAAAIILSDFINRLSDG